MRIQHNIMAMNAYRNYNTNTSALSKNLEKLSSGYKINRAGDDAAGLAISEKMRAQITGLNAAQKNVKDGISLVKTAEGAMQEIQDMLNRMDYLATQSANGTYDDDVDRYNLQKEVNQLRSEIDRIADSANFNGIKLLNGDMSLAKPVSTTVNVTVDAVTTTLGVSASGGTLSGASAQLDANFVPSGNGIDGIHLGTDSQTVQGASFTIDLTGVTFTGVSNGGTGSLVTINIGGKAFGLAVTDSNTDGNVSGADFAASFAAANTQTVINGVTFDVANDTGKLTFTVAAASITGTVMAGSINSAINGATVSLDIAAGSGIVGDKIHGLQDVQLARAATNGDLAGISFKLDGTVVGDGNTLKIGNKTFIFGVGAGSTVTQGSADFLITVNAADAAGFAEAAQKIALTMNGQELADTATGRTNEKFEISLVGDATIHLDQKMPSSGTPTTYDDAAMLKGLFEVVRKQTAPVQASIELSATPGAADGLNEGDLVSYKTTETVDGETKEVTKSFIIGTAPTGAKNADSYITAASFNALLQDDANKGLKAAADKVLAQGGTYAGFTASVSGNNVVITANNASGADDQDKMDDLKAAIQSAAKITISKISAADAAKSGLTLQIGDTSDVFNRLKVNVGDMHVDAMGTMETTVEGGRQTAVTGKSIADIDISNLKGAQEAIDVIKNAINYVSSIRGDLGATQNRLEHTANNLSVMAENIQDAESTIRDTDVAEEMMAYTKNNILIQSAQAMLAQANAVPQGVLQLLG